MTLLGGDEDLIALKVGRLSICVGCVVVVSRSRKKALGEQGIVSPASSSSSSMVIVSLFRDGVRGSALECRTGKGEELLAMVTKADEEKKKGAVGLEKNPRGK